MAGCGVIPPKIAQPDADESGHQPKSTTSFSWLDYYPVQPPQIDLSDDEDEELTTPAADSSMSTSSSSTSVPWCAIYADAARHTCTAHLTTDLSIQTLQRQASGMTISPHTAEDEFPNPFDPGFSRTGFLRQRLHARQDRWSQRKTVKCVVFHCLAYVPVDSQDPLGNVQRQ